MKKIAIIAITLFLLLSVVNFGTSEPMMEYNSNPNPDNSSENSVIDNVQEQQIIQNMNRLDGFFTENKGQVGNDSVRYYIQGKGVWFLDDGVVYEIRGPPEPAVLQRERFDRSHPEFEPVMSAPRKSVVLRLNFEGCNKIEPKGVGMLPHQSNYFFGNDSSKWCINVPNFQEIVYENIYDDIDLRYYSNDKGLKYDFKVHPGGNPEDIKIKCEGVQDLLLNTPFELIFHTPLGDIIDTGLFIYQDFPKQCNAVHGKFKLVNSKTFGFEIFGNYDKTKTLIIDPVVFSSFVGGSNVETGAKIATDSNLNIYVTGSTNSNNFPNTTGANDTTYNNGYDIFVFKMNPSGSSLVYSTFIGGTADDLGYDIALDLSKNVYVTGRTKSSDFPFTSGANDTSYNGGTIGDAIVFKLNQSGSKLSYSTFIGSGADDEGNGITVDINGNAYITGYTTSNTFPTTPGSWNESNSGSADAFILKLDASGSTIVFSTYIGGSEGDKGWGIAINSNNDVFITGHTVSSDFPITPGAYDDSHNTWTDIFISKLNKTGSTLMYSTFIGGNKEDSGDEIIIDDLENVYVTGTTWSDDFPTSITAYDDSYNQGYDCYVLKLNLTNSMLLYSTYIGGGDYDEGNGLALDASNNIYLTGYTFSQDFPNTTNALDTSHNGASDIFLLKLNQTGSSLVYSTYLGGSNHDRGQSVAIDILGDLCLTGNTESNNFPNTTNSFDPIHNGNRDAFVFKFRLNTLPLVLDIQKSENEIFRADTISIFSNGSDNEDIEKNLRPHFEYRDPNEQVWNNTCFTMLQYQDSRWEVGFTPPINATLGLYDFRVRLNDTFNQFSTWFYLNDSLLVLNNIPKTEEITLSNNSALLDDNMLIWINSTDIEETEENLTTELEYRDPNEVLWNKTYLSSPTYNNGKWEYSFNIPFDALFGYYDLRARVNDSDGNYSTWIYLNDSLRIYNTGPKVIDAGLSEISIYRTEPVFLYINGTDHETPEDIISFYIQYKPQNEGDWTNLTGNYLNYTWEVCFTTYIDSILGSYDFRVKFEDNESISSGWKYVNDSLEVLNNLPMISDTLDDISVGIQPLILDLTQYESDIEDTDLNLTWSISPQIFSYIESIELIDSVNDTFEITPVVNVTGIEDIELTLTDKDTGMAVKSDVTINIDSTVSEFTPKVTLLSPVNKAVINTLTPTLNWELDYSGTEIITYSVAIDENPDPQTTIKTGLTTTEYILENELVDGKTYYWKVEPSIGICLSGAFRFTIDLGFEPIYKVNLTAEQKTVTIKQGEYKDINITVTNEGNSIDNFKIEINSINLQSQTSVDKTNIQLDPDRDSIVKLTIDIPDDFTTGDYSITVTAVSLVNINAQDEVTIDVKVVSKFFIPDYDVSISISPLSLELEQGDSENVTITITNDGNIEDDFTIRFESDDFTSADIQSSERSLKLTDGESDTITLTIKVPENMEPGEYSIKFIVESDDVSNESILTITVKDKDGEEPTDGDEDNTMLYALIGIIIVIIVVLILLFIFLKKKGTEEETIVEKAQPPPPEEVPTEMPQPTQVPEPETPPPEQPPTQEVPPEQVPTQEMPPEQIPDPEISSEQLPPPEQSLTPEIIRKQVADPEAPAPEESQPSSETQPEPMQQSEVPSKQPPTPDVTTQAPQNEEP